MTKPCNMYIYWLVQEWRYSIANTRGLRLSCTNPSISWSELLTHWGLVTPFGDLDVDQHWHQVITWTNVDLSSVRSSGIYLGAISLEIPQPPFTKVFLKTYLKLNWNLPGANELIKCISLLATQVIQRIPCIILIPAFDMGS